MSLELAYTTLPKASVISIVALFTSDGSTIVISPLDGFGYTNALMFALLSFNPKVVTNWSYLVCAAAALACKSARLSPAITARAKVTSSLAFTLCDVYYWCRSV